MDRLNLGEACKINGKNRMLKALFLPTNSQGSLGQRKATMLSMPKDGEEESHSRCLQDESVCLFKKMLYPNINHWLQ